MGLEEYSWLHGFCVAPRRDCRRIVRTVNFWLDVAQHPVGLRRSTSAVGIAVNNSCIARDQRCSAHCSVLPELNHIASALPHASTRLRAKPESEAYEAPKVVFRPRGFAAPLVVPPARGEARVLPAIGL